MCVCVCVSVCLQRQSVVEQSKAFNCIVLVQHVKQCMHRKRCLRLCAVGDDAVKVYEAEVVKLSVRQLLVEGLHALPWSVPHPHQHD